MELVKRFLVIPILFLVHSLCAQDFEFYPGAVYDPAIPTLQQVVGHAWGEKITSPDEMARYIRALTDASPRVEVVEYGQTWEGRKLFYLVVSSEEHLTRLQEIKAGLQKLADPRKISRAEAERLIQSLPVVTWLAYAVHGNEISSTDAALLTAYHLAAAQNDSVAEIALRNSIVILDPLQNPDGRDRFVHYFRQTRGRWPDPDQQAAEHNEDWPGGRTNHYLFDMNRDWFALTQPETRGRVRAYLDWYPQVFVDLHEMGSNSTYYFAPPAAPLNPEMPSAQVKWLRKFGEHIARWFDRMKFDYFTREVFDSFYPGYGEGWPMMHGAIGMTYEQASVRGLVVRRNDESTMHYRDSVQHHFISSLATVQTAASQREGLLRYFYDYRASAIREGQQEPVKAYLFPPGPDPNRTEKLVSLLVTQGIEVKRAEQPFTLGRTEDFYGGGTRSKRFPTGTYVVSLAQPEKRLAKTLLAKQISMGRKFIQEQVRRYKKHLPDEIYDLTGWSLPLLFDVPAYTTTEPPAGKFTVLQQPVAPRSQISGEAARLAYLIPWGRNASARALAHLLRQGIRVFSSDKNFTLASRTFPRGSLIVKVRNNPKDLHDRLKTVASETGAEVVSTNTSWVQEGVNFGSENVHFLKKPKIAMAYNLPTHPYSVGWTRFLLEQVYDLPVTVINTRQLTRSDLSKYNVLILPNSVGFFGNYKQILGERGAKKINTWVENGGTLITFAEATHWLTEEKVGLLATTRELKGGRPEKEKKPQAAKKGAPEKPKSGAAAALSQPFDLETAIQPEKELPPATPGAIMRVTLDTEHWLTSGYDGDANVLVSSRNIFTPLKLDKGRNIAVYMAEDKVLLSGFTWKEAQKQLAHKAYLMYQPHGRGHVVAFAEDPNFRAFMDGLNLLFLNAVFFGPAH